MLVSTIVIALFFIGIVAMLVINKKERDVRQAKIDAIDSKLHKLNFYITEFHQTKEFDWNRVINLHKKLAEDDVLPENCGIDKYGMYRADSIAELNEDNIYLGNIYGLWTFPY